MRIQTRRAPRAQSIVVVHTFLLDCLRYASSAHLLFLASLGIGLMGFQHTPAFYPIGIYSTGNTNHLSTIRSAGFNLVAGAADQKYLDFAEGQGLKVLAAPGTSAGKNFSKAKALNTIKALNTHPALWAWYLVDEPDL